MENDYKALAEKYNYFAAPIMKVIVDGTEVTAGQQMVVENLSISLSLNRAGSVQFNVINVFQLGSREFSDEVKNNFQLGKILSVEIGYSSDTTKLFQGYISELSFDFGENPEVRITALDFRRLMMDTCYQNHTYAVTSYSQAFQEVMKRYGKFYEQMEVETTGDEIKNVVQNGSDYKFVQEQLCAKANKEFMILGGTVYFRTPKSGAEPVACLEWGEGLISFQERKSQCNQTIRVYGKADNKKDKQMVEVIVTDEGSDEDIVVIKEYKNAGLVGEAAIQQYANKLANHQRDAGRSGSGICIGLPELVPGNYIKLGNLGLNQAKEYYINSVRHSIGSSGYTTQFDVEGIRI